MGVAELHAFLNTETNERHVSPFTHNLALSALPFLFLFLFLYREVFALVQGGTHSPLDALVLA